MAVERGEILLSLADVSVLYQAVVAARNVTFDVHRGDYFCIVGANGSGKSSLVKAILGIVPAASGRIRFLIDRERVAYVPQSSTIMKDFPATVWEIVLTGRQSLRQWLPFYTKADKDAAHTALDLLNVGDIKERRIGELSGGQLQRVLLARALCSGPEVLILDEPSAGLDEVSTEQLAESIAGLNRSEGLTVVMVTHDMNDVRGYANRVAVMDNALEFCGPVEEWGGFCDCRAQKPEKAEKRASAWA